MANFSLTRRAMADLVDIARYAQEYLTENHKKKYYAITRLRCQESSPEPLDQDFQLLGQ